MWTITFFAGLFVFLCGFSIRVFKISYLIAGYNTLSKEEKKKYDDEKVIKFVSNMIMISSAFLIIGGILSMLFEVEQEILFNGCWLFFVVSLFIGIIYFNISGYAKK
jgi:Domain of unknown function (DUF3784)